MNLMFIYVNSETVISKVIIFWKKVVFICWRVDGNYTFSATEFFNMGSN